MISSIGPATADQTLRRHVNWDLMLFLRHCNEKFNRVCPMGHKRHKVDGSTKSIPATICDENLNAWKSKTWQPNQTDKRIMDKAITMPHQPRLRGESNVSWGTGKGVRRGHKKLGWSPLHTFDSLHLLLSAHKHNNYWCGEDPRPKILSATKRVLLVTETNVHV